MTNMTPKTRLTTLSVVLAALALAGCHIEEIQNNPIDVVNSHTFDVANWQQRPGTIENQVEEITLVHTINFTQGDSELSGEEMGELLKFLQESGVHDGARIEIDGPRDQGGYHDPLTAARMSAIKAELTSIGLRSQVPARPITSLAKPEEAIAVTVSRAMVILPDCTTPQPEFALRPRAHFGCSNAAALGMMIADPLDLERGRAIDSADGEVASRSIQRYRAGKTKAIKIESSK